MGGYVGGFGEGVLCAGEDGGWGGDLVGLDVRFGDAFWFFNKVDEGDLDGFEVCCSRGGESVCFDILP